MYTFQKNTARLIRNLTGLINCSGIIPLFKKYLLLSSIFLGAGPGLFSQITVTNTTFPVVGDTLRYAIDSLPSVPLQNIFTPPGGNQVWNLTALHVDVLKPDIIRPASQGLSASWFPLASFMIKEDANTEAYYRVQNNSVDFLGVRGIVPGSPDLPAVIIFQPARVVRRAPMNFFDISQKSSSFLVGFDKSQLPPSFLNSLAINLDSIRIRESYSEIEVVDAYGTLSIPNGSFPVLRSKRTTYEETRMDAKVPPLGWLDITDLAIQKAGLDLGVDTTVRFLYFNNNAKEIIAEALLDNAQTFIVRVKYKNIPGTLPVSLLAFSGIGNGPVNVLLWKTASEINSHAFEVERSQNGQAFTRIGSVASMSMPNGASYRFQDDLGALAKSDFFYRLKMVDKDGRFAYSNVIKIQPGADRKMIALAGNVTDHYIQLLIPISLETTSLKADIISPHGMVQASYSISPANSRLNVNQLAPGQYFIRFSQQGRLLHSEKFVKR